MKRRIFSFLLALVLLFELTPLPLIEALGSENNVNDQASTENSAESTQNTENNENYIEGMVDLTCDGETNVTLIKGDKIYAFATPDASLGKGVRYSWQLKTSNGKWATVSGYVSYYAVISEALIANATDENGFAYMRCIVLAQDQEYVSNVLTFCTSDGVPEIPVSESFELAEMPTRYSSPDSAEEAAVNSGNNETLNAFHIVINYTYCHATEADGQNINGSTAHNTFTVTLPTNAFYSGTVISPPEIGYLPYVEVKDAKYVPDALDANGNLTYDTLTYGKEGEEKEYILANSIEFFEQKSNVEINVYYIPQKVTFCVKIYEQNLYDDEYTLAETVTYTGVANERVGEGYDHDRYGFTSLYYVPDTPISEDGSFVLDIYYDRVYYLVNFDLNDGQDNNAYGANNYFVRYTTAIMLPTPSRPGHSFIQWALTEVTIKHKDKTTEIITSHNYPTSPNGGYLISSVEHNLDYQASWKVEKTSYTVIYWLENTDNDSFTLDSFKVVNNVTPGTTVSATNDLAISDASCFTFSKDLSDQNVVVAADGTTAVNAYYLRNHYTITFKGTAVCITPEHTHSAACQSGNCQLKNHTHVEKCGRVDLICGQEEHIHVDESCILDVHEHSTIVTVNGVTTGCCTIPYHVHGTGASSDCTKTEHPIHHDSCYSRNTLKDADILTDDNQKTAYQGLQDSIEGPVNGYVYRYRTKKSNNTSNVTNVYNFLYVHDHWFYLGSGSTYDGVDAPNIANPDKAAGSISSAKATSICGYELHTHGDGNCTCKEIEHDHTSGCTCSIPRHVHGEGDCIYECGKNEHTHSLKCYTHNCGEVEHTHTASCVRTCQQIEHAHTSSCTTKSSRNFLTLKSKYNTDISWVWTEIEKLFTNGERWKASTYFDQVLVYLPFVPPANITFTSDAGTASEIYNISYYLESLGTTEYFVQNKYFDLKNTVSAKYNYLTYNEDFFEIPGFTRFTSNPAFSNNQIETNKGGNVALYYSRNDYKLNFVSLGTTVSTKTLKYQSPIDDSYELLEKDVPYPSNKEAGAIRFVGWYTTPNCADGTEFVFDGQTTMPIGGLVLYAKWETRSYTINVYSNIKHDMLLLNQTVLFDTLVAEPDYTIVQHPGGLTPGEPHPDLDEDQEHWIFTGWYYFDNGDEVRYDFNTMPVKQDMEIFAKWTSRIPIPYTIRYVYFDGTKYNDLAEPVTHASLAGITKNFTAKVGAELNKLDPKDQNKYFPDVRSHTMTMSSIADENVYYFTYSCPDTISYKIVHTFTGTKATASTEPTVFEEIFAGCENPNTLSLEIPFTVKGEDLSNLTTSMAVSFRTALTEANIYSAAAKKLGRNLEPGEQTKLKTAITNMSPNMYIQNLILTTDAEQNVATFNWGNRDNLALYQIIYYIESVDGTTYTVYKDIPVTATVGTEIIATQEKIEHFTLDLNHVNTIKSGKVTATEFNADGTLKKGLVLRLYYKRDEYPYTIEYRSKTGSGNEISESVTLTAKYEYTFDINDMAKEIPGYKFAAETDPVKKIKKVTNKGLTFICFYDGLEVHYRYQVIGMGGTIDGDTDKVIIGDKTPESRTLQLWSDGYMLRGWYYAIDDGEFMPVQDGQDGWDISDDQYTISLPKPEAQDAGKTIYVYAEVVPISRRFQVAGYASPENDPQAFVFRLQGTAGTATAGIDLTFIIFDTGYIDIEYLPYGVYTLTTLHWAWRPGHPTTVVFNNISYGLEHDVGYVELDLRTSGDVTINYPNTLNDDWLSDDASGIVPLSPNPNR